MINIAFIITIAVICIAAHLSFKREVREWEK